MDIFWSLSLFVFLPLALNHMAGGKPYNVLRPVGRIGRGVFCMTLGIVSRVMGSAIKLIGGSIRTIPAAWRGFRKGRQQTAKLCYMGHATTENRNGLVLATAVTSATGTAERETAESMLSGLGGDKRITVGADKAYDTKEFVRALRSLKVTPHVSQNDTNRKSAIDGRTTRHSGYTVSVRKRKRIEQVFGWLKTVGGFRKLRLIGLSKVEWLFTFATAAYNLVRIGNLLSPEV
jgi:IS5 family transposase